MLVSCAKVFYSPDCSAIAQSHKMVAISPPSIAITARKKVDELALKEQEKAESITFQQEMYSWMLRRKMQGKINVEIQDIETTNAKLKKAGYPDKALSPDEICGVLGVDGLITSNYSLSKPMSEGGAVALGLITGVWGPTNEVTVAMSIHDGKTKKMIWNYNHKFSGGVGSNSAELVDGLMRNASKKLPYMR